MTEAADDEPDSQKTANLARIRDNQRRSRARRKDYLKELETRYRTCEQVGVSASTELQAAAKSVAEENRRLRDLLKAYGIPDAEIDSASGSKGAFAADMLESMVNSRQPCGPGDTCKSAIDSERQIQPAPQVITQQPTCPPTVVYQEPITSAHSATTTPQFFGQLPSPASLPGRKHSTDTLYDPIGLPPSHLPVYGYNVHASEHPGFMNGYVEQTANQNPPRSIAPYDDMSSCQIAADTIRTFSPNAGYELEQELGCGAPGEDCTVSNLKIFNVIDRYTVGAD